MGALPASWSQPSPCEGWLARDVLAHVVDLSDRALIAFSNVDVKANSGAPPSGPGAPAKPAALVGFTPEPVERVDYERGALAPWPASEHIVTVAVRTERLIVYGPAGEPHDYVAGETFTAGWTAYRTVNETNAIVETLLTRH